MTDYRYLLWIVSLLGSIPGSNASSLPSNTSNHFPMSLNSSRHGNGTYSLFKNSSYVLGGSPRNISESTTVTFQTTATLVNIPTSSQLSASLSTLAEATSTTTEPAMLPSPMPQEFEHTIDPVWPTSNHSSELDDRKLALPPHEPSNPFLPRPTNIISMMPTNLSSNYSAMNHTATSFRRPANISEDSDMALPSQDVRNIDNIQMLSLNDSNLPLHNESHSWDRDLYNASSHMPMNMSGPVLNALLHHHPWLNGAQYPPFENSLTWIGKPANASEIISEALRLHRSRDNSDLYPPTDFSNITLKHNCHPRNLNKTSKSRLSRRSPRQANTDSKSYHNACWERDAEFFEFSEENIWDSEVFEWYARWTVEVRDKKLQQYTEHGEWRMFYRWWLQEYDFRCGYDFSACRNAKRREDVQNTYPGEENMNLVRRIYFITLMYDYLHDHTKMMQETFRNLHVDLSGHVMELVGTFTQHGDPHGMKLCEMYKIMIQTTVNTAIGFLNTIAAGAAAPFWFVPGQGLGKSTLTIGDPVGGNLKPGLVNGDLIGFRDGQKVSFGLYQWVTGTVSQLTVSNWQTWQMLAEQRIAKEQPVIMTGMGRGWSGLCASVEGDFQDQSAVNAERLSQYLSLTFQHIREATYDTFHDIYIGKIIPQPGNPSFMAVVMANRKWVGENSIVFELEDARPMQRLIRGNTLKSIISKLLTESQNWMKCTHYKNAPKMCEKASQARGFGIKGNGVDRSRFCPHPETDPTYICEVGGWYFADDHQHQRRMCGLDSLETFWGNEFNFTLEQFMSEVHTNYETCGNNCTEVRLEELAFDSNYGAARGFAIPVCRSDHVHLDNFLKRGPTRWHFPSICGDFRSDETEGFMKAANMGPDSQAAQTQSIQQLWRDRIPREIEGLRPFTYFMTLCAHGIRFPDKWKWETPHDKLHNVKNTFNHYQIPYHHKPCGECDWVKNNTQGMDEMEANHFFCESRYVWENILTQQASHIDMVVAPTARFENLQTKCKKWMKKHGGKPPYKAKSPSRVDFEDGWRLFWDNVWRALPITLPISIAEAVEVSKIKID